VASRIGPVPAATLVPVTRRWSAAIALVLVGLLAGCGDDETADPQYPVTVTETVTGTPTPSETASTPPATEPTEPTESAEPAESITPSPAVDLSQPPTTSAEAQAHLDAALEAGAPQELRRFESKDGTYYCSLGDRFIRPSCEILEGVTDPAVCADSPSQKVGRIELTRRGWQPFCNTDTIRMPGAPVLPDRSVATWPALSVQCVIEAIGITCLEAGSQQGFFFGPGRYQVFAAG
jgi:hypothetical protein